MTINLGFECLKNQTSESSYNIADMLIDSTTICMHMESINDISKELDKSFEILNHMIEINTVLKKYNKDVAIESLFGKEQLEFSCEGIKEVWTKIVEFFKMLFSRIKEYLVYNHHRIESRKRDIISIIKQLEELDKSDVKEMTIEMPDFKEIHDRSDKLFEVYNKMKSELMTIFTYVFSSKSDQNEKMLERAKHVFASFHDAIDKTVRIEDIRNINCIKGLNVSSKEFIKGSITGLKGLISIVDRIDNPDKIEKYFNQLEKALSNNIDKNKIEIINTIKPLFKDLSDISMAQYQFSYAAYVRVENGIKEIKK